MESEFLDPSLFPDPNAHVSEIFLLPSSAQSFLPKDSSLVAFLFIT